MFVVIQIQPCSLQKELNKLDSHWEGINELRRQHRMTEYLPRHANIDYYCYLAEHENTHASTHPHSHTQACHLQNNHCTIIMTKSKRQWLFVYRFLAALAFVLQVFLHVSQCFGFHKVYFFVVCSRGVTDERARRGTGRGRAPLWIWSRFLQIQGEVLHLARLFRRRGRGI